MRVREETEFKPKPMVLIGSRPILWHIMRLYEAHGFHRFVICLGYRGDSIREYFLNYEFMNRDFTIDLSSGKKRFEQPDPSHAGSWQGSNWEVTLAETGLDAMTGARVKRIEKYVDSDYFLCTYGDGLANVDLRELVRFHRAHGKIATITGVAPPSRFGALMTSGEKVERFVEKPQLEDSLISGGFFVFDRRIFTYLSSDDSCVLEHGPFVNLARDGEMMVFRHSGYWQCMDTIRDVHALNEELRGGNPGWLRR